jgi:hypothetical protein
MVTFENDKLNGVYDVTGLIKNYTLTEKTTFDKFLGKDWYEAAKTLKLI